MSVKKFGQFFDCSIEEVKKDILGQELNGELKKLFGKKDNCLDSGEWDEICMLNLCFDINEEMSGKFRINELGYDMNKYVSYDKGCYRGQEIIARLTYLGKKTKKVVVFNSGFEEITNADDRPIGKKIFSLDSKDKEYSHFFVESTDYFSEGKKITPVTNQWDLDLDCKNFSFNASHPKNTEFAENGEVWTSNIFIISISCFFVLKYPNIKFCFFLS